MNIYIVYEINLWPFTVGKDFVLGNSLFGAIKFTKNATDFDKYKYFIDKYKNFGYAIGYGGSFSLSDGSGFVKKHNNI